MRPLSGLDAAFLYLENPRSPMHIGSVWLLDAADAPANFGYEVFREHIRSRLPLAPLMRERLFEIPFNLTHAQWLKDPDFELDFHLPHVALPRPGGPEQLRHLATQYFSRPLNRSRPLWELAFVEGVNDMPGLAPGSWALISRVHHAAIDGGSGAELMGTLLDPTPTPRPAPEDDDWEPDEPPGMARLALGAAARLGIKTRSVGGLLRGAAAGAARLYGAARVAKLRPPTLPFSAPSTLFNAPVSAQRTFSAVDLDLARIKAIKNASRGVTVNDVVLAVCAGGLRNYLLEKDALPDKPLVAMAPISVRSRDQKGTMGNQVSAMLVGLETHEPDPRKRLKRIRGNTTRSKLYAGAVPANRLIEMIPTATAALAARLYSRTAVGDGSRPFFNLVITNVPGPQQPLYLAGARVVATYGTAPLIDGLGLILVIFSYAGRLSIGITSCTCVVPDPERLGALIQQSLEELESALTTVAADTLRDLAPPVDQLKQTVSQLEAYLEEQKAQ